MTRRRILFLVSFCLLFGVLVAWRPIYYTIVDISRLVNRAENDVIGEPPPPDDPAVDSTIVFGGPLHPAPTPVTDVCGECHREIVDQYARSGMSRSWRSLGAAEVAMPPLDGIVRDDVGAYAYRVIQESNQLYVEESLPSLGRQRQNPHRVRVAVSYLVGSGNHAVALASRQANAVQMMPVAWFSGEQQWKFTPGYEGNNLRFSRPVTDGCVSCHATFGELRQPSLNLYQGPIVDGIGCQRCHGPAEEHVRQRKAAASTADTASTPDNAKTEVGVDGMVNPSKLSPARANDVCFQCHLQGIVPLPQPGHDAFSFRPGDRLSDHRLDFLLNTNNPSAFGVASHGARMMQSRCYLASDRKLTCIQCHDPHQPVSDVQRETYDRQCLTCHQAESCHRPREPASATAETSCTRCHMPQRSTHEGQHLVFTDHWIRRDAGKFQPEPAVLSADGEMELSPVWPLADPHQIRLGAAYVWLHEAIGPQRRGLAKGVSLLTQARKAGFRDPHADYWLAGGMMGMRRTNEAAELLQSSLAGESSGESPESRAKWKLAIAWRQMGKQEQAIALFEQCAEQFPFWTEVLEQLGFAYMDGGKFPEAVRVLRQQVEYGETPQALTNLAVALAESGGSLDEADKLLARALAWDPKFVPAHLNRGWLCHRRGELAAAVDWYESALQLDPRNVQATAALQALQQSPK